MSVDTTRKGIALIVASTLIFAIQDAFSRHLAETYNVFMVVMIRYWFFAAFVVALAARKAGGLGSVIRTRQPLLQITRGLLLVGEVCVMVVSFTLIGLSATHAVFASYPLMIALLAGPMLGERIGWRRKLAILAGFTGVLVILQPGTEDLSLVAAIPLAAAFLFALYGVLTRRAVRIDGTATSFFWTGTVGAAAISLIGPWYWEPMAPADWGIMACLCVTAALGHWCLIRAYELAEAGTLQPFNYLQLVFATTIGMAVFGETITAVTVLGASMVVGAGLFTIWRARAAGGRDAPAGIRR